MKNMQSLILLEIVKSINFYFNWKDPDLKKRRGRPFLVSIDIKERKKVWNMSTSVHYTHCAYSKDTFINY